MDKINFPPESKSRYTARVEGGCRKYAVVYVLGYSKLRHKTNTAGYTIVNYTMPTFRASVKCP
jgi:hypothetical protein